MFPKPRSGISMPGSLAKGNQERSGCSAFDALTGKAWVLPEECLGVTKGQAG